jgi:glycosyltransferase involved in cell wall biosynthesis
VRVLSLGKEVGQSKFKYLLNFYKFIWRERKNYDAVFVHMNQEYVLLGAPFWRFMGKKTYMWRNHHAGNLLTDLAGILCNKVFCTSKFSYTAKFRKTVLMPVGIDTDLFKRKGEIQRVKNSILFLGRISPVKKPDLLIDVLIKLNRDGVNFTASFFGDSLPKDRTYHDSLINKVLDAGLSEKIKFYPGIPNDKTVDVYNKHEIFVNLSSSGMYDKTIFEAMACECLILASNNNLKGLIEEVFIFEEDNFFELENKLSNLLKLNTINSYGGKLRSITVEFHSLRGLMSKLKKNI